MFLSYCLVSGCLTFLVTLPLVGTLTWLTRMEEE